MDEPRWRMVDGGRVRLARLKAASMTDAAASMLRLIGLCPLGWVPVRAEIQRSTHGATAYVTVAYRLEAEARRQVPRGIMRPQRNPVAPESHEPEGR